MPPSPGPLHRPRCPELPSDSLSSSRQAGERAWGAGEALASRVQGDRRPHLPLEVLHLPVSLIHLHPIRVLGQEHIV